MNERQSGPRQGGLNARQILGGAALVLLLLWVVLNTQEVEVDLLVTTVTMPLFIALIIAGLLGALVAWLLPRIRSGGD
jgi:uncharacterized integral membrane protein